MKIAVLESGFLAHVGELYPGILNRSFFGEGYSQGIFVSGVGNRDCEKFGVVCEAVSHRPGHVDLSDLVPSQWLDEFYVEVEMIRSVINRASTISDVVAYLDIIDRSLRPYS